MRRTPLVAFASVLLAAFVSVTSALSAQTATGQITGVVRDATGGVMPGVKIVVTNQQTGLTRETKSGTNGDYVIPLLPVGVYVVSGEQAGFKTAVLSDVVAHCRPDSARRHDAGSGKRDRDGRGTVDRAPRWIRAVPRSAIRSPRSRSPSCRSTVATSCSCCSLVPARWRPPVASRVECGKEWVARSASWAPGRRRTIS